MTPREVYKRSQKCRVGSQQYGAGSRKDFKRSRPKYPVYYNEMRTKIICESRIPRYAYVRFYGPPKQDSPVWVRCSCEHFGYTYAWVLEQYGSSTLDTDYQNRGVKVLNQPPRIRNENERPGLCKHLLVAARVALAQTKDLASEQGKETEERGASFRAARNEPRIHVPKNVGWFS